MTPVVFISGMHISDNGNLVIDADEMDAAGVRELELIEGVPESERRRRLLEISDERVNRLSAQITELSARLEEYNHACETLGIKKDVLAYISGLRTGYDMEIEALEARLKEAENELAEAKAQWASYAEAQDAAINTTA